MSSHFALSIQVLAGLGLPNRVRHWSSRHAKAACGRLALPAQLSTRHCVFLWWARSRPAQTQGQLPQISHQWGTESWNGSEAANIKRLFSGWIHKTGLKAQFTVHFIHPLYSSRFKQFSHVFTSASVVHASALNTTGAEVGKRVKYIFTESYKFQHWASSRDCNKLIWLYQGGITVWILFLKH